MGLTAMRRPMLNLFSIATAATKLLDAFLRISY
jgi:hypothetical protein